MTVEFLAQRIRDLLKFAESQPSAADDGLIKFLDVLGPLGQHSIDDFLVLLAKLKKPKAPAAPRKPKKSAAEIEAERRAKAAQKVELARSKAEAKARAEAEKLVAKAAEARAKAEAKIAAENEKRRGAEVAAQEKAAAKLRAEDEKRQQKVLDDGRRREEAGKAVRDSIDELRALLMRFRGGNVPKDAVDPPLEKLASLKAPELLAVARALNADATLTEKSTKAKILKQLTEMIRRVWKTSDNVNH